MSLTDPDAERRRRDAEVPTAGRLVLPALVAFLQPALATIAMSGMVANAMDDVFDGTSVVALVIALPGTGATVFAIMRWAALSLRNPGLPGITAPLGLAALGAAAGLSMAAPPPAWVQAPAANLGVVLLGILGVLLLGATLFARGSRLRRRALDDEIMRTSRPVTGVVTNKGYTLPATEASAILTTVTYAFADAAGTRRFVRKSESIPMTDPLVDGERVDVWFDRADPSDVRRIVVRRRPESAR